MSACDHDWRVNPHVQSTAWPPVRRIVCALCGCQSVQPVPASAASHDPHTWPKAFAA